MKRILLLLLTIAIGEDAYAYDTAGRLISATTHPTVGGAARTETFTYDAFGNRTGNSVDGVSHPVGVDPANNRLVGATYDVVGNMTEGVMSGVWGARTYRYDALSRMTAVGQGSFQRRMLYDASDERIATVVDDSLTRWTLRDLQGRLLREYHSDSGGTWIWESDYVHAGGQLVAGETQPYFYQDEGGTWVYGGERHYHLDHLGSVRLVTDWAGRSLTEHDYAPFGVTTTKTYQEPSVPSGHVDAMRYAGHWRDFLGWENVDNTEYLDYMHARYYDPNLGRFLSVDPVLDVKAAMAEPQMWNRYSYVTNNPLKFTDPDGRYRTFYGEKPMTAENLAMDENTPAVVKASVYASGGLAALGAGGLFFAGGSGGGLAAGAFRLPAIARGNFIETALATAFGGGLPRTFPVIDRFLNGVATSVKSLDLGAKTYQNAQRLTSTLTGFVDKLAQFNGARLGNVQVQGGAITQRVLEVVVQRGAATPQQTQAIQRAAAYAKEHDVVLKVITVR